MPFPDATLSGNDLFSSFINMDIDETSLPSLPPPNLSLRDLDLSFARSSTSGQNPSVGFPPLFPNQTATHHNMHPSSSRGRTRSPVPFSFRGGAPCIVPFSGPPTTANTISLNSDDESDNTSSRYQHYWHHTKAHDTDSSHPSKHSAQTFPHLSDSTNPTPGMVSTPPTSVHDNTSSSIASGSRRSAAKGKQRAQVSPAVSANERLVSQVDELISKGKGITESLRDDRARRRGVHYQDKEAERSHQQWLTKFNAEHEQNMAKLKLEQLERELELERLRRSN
ncbi:hypothetical protein EV363DRAFT_1294409 [Boletus edulis]|nr:hypothetical protein EV363DRAFT_1294409 [Boletus edulis]